ncbi:MAG: hypothetical protein VB051_04025 [Candidatus Pelethousia sp.]|nr:hypothetical protein [Candidatus Pelethousia sp.]
MPDYQEMYHRLLGVQLDMINQLELIIDKLIETHRYIMELSADSLPAKAPSYGHKASKTR